MKRVAASGTLKTTYNENLCAWMEILLWMIRADRKLSGINASIPKHFVTQAFEPFVDACHTRTLPTAWPSREANLP